MVPTKEFIKEKENLEKEIGEKLQYFSTKNGIVIVSANINHFLSEDKEDKLVFTTNIVFGR